MTELGKRNERDGRIRAGLLGFRRYLLFFLFMAFVISCCMILFLNTLSDATGLTWNRSNLEAAARVTFVNVLLLSLLCTIVDEVRRRILVGRPVQQIVEATERMAKGDFSARIPHAPALGDDNGLNLIADYVNRMAEELSGMETLRNDFVANVSHEMKTPLAVIQSYGTMLCKPGLSEEQRIEYASAVVDASAGLSGLVTNILRLNRLENQRIYPASEPHDLGEQLRGCLLGFEEAWEIKQLDVDVNIDDSEPVMVDVDHELLALVWNNLISNAIKFTEPHGTISLTMQADGDRAVVQVGDTGCGIDPQTGSHIFEKFYQGDTSHATQGNGLGLALVKRVVDIVGGDIAVNSEVGVGSTFTVTLRRASATSSRRLAVVDSSASVSAA